MIDAASSMITTNQLSHNNHLIRLATLLHAACGTVMEADAHLC